MPQEGTQGVAKVATFTNYEGGSKMTDYSKLIWQCPVCGHHNEMCNMNNVKTDEQDCFIDECEKCETPVNVRLVFSAKLVAERLDVLGD